MYSIFQGTLYGFILKMYFSIVMTCLLVFTILLAAEGYIVNETEGNTTSLKDFV